MMNVQQASAAKPLKRKATGGAFESRGRFYCRVTVGPQRRRAVLLPWCTCLRDAEARARALQALVQDLRRAGQQGFVDATLENGAKYDETDLAELVRSVAGIVKGRILPDEPGKGGAPETFRTFSEKWTSGELHALYPDACAPATPVWRRAASASSTTRSATSR
jgi:hypothetical protein